MLSYQVSNAHELLLEKEISKLKEENDLLKGVISDYRDCLISINSQFQKSLILEENQKEQVSEEDKRINLPLWKLTTAERNVLNVLLVEKENAISREKLANKLWGGSDSPSYMSRLSTIMRKLRMKLKIENEDQEEQEIIRTCWGEGYQLTEVFFEFYKVDEHFMKEYEKAQ